MDTEQHSDRYWRSGSLLYIGVPLGDAEELTEGQYDTLKFEELKADIRRMRDERIDAVEWRVRRYQDEEILGLPHTDDVVMLAHHIQALRDVPQQSGFPYDVVWPILDIS